MAPRFIWSSRDPATGCWQVKMIKRIGPPHRPYRDEDEAIFYMIRGLKLKDLEDYVLLPLN
jgi:hypothetical protein